MYNNEVNRLWQKIWQQLYCIFFGLYGAVLGKYLIVFFISLLPILELRGALILAMINMYKKKALLAIIGGVVMAGIIMLILSYGLLNRIIS